MIREPEDTWSYYASLKDTVLLDGFHALKHALRFDAEIYLAITVQKDRIFTLAHDLAPDIRQVLSTVIAEVPAEVYRRCVPAQHPTGVAALARRATYTADYERSAPLILLEDPRSPGNVGAVVRLAAGFGAAAVVTTGGLDPWSGAALRGSAGLHFACRVEQLELDTLPYRPIFGLDPAGEDIQSAKIPDTSILAFGSERAGLSRDLRDRCDQLISIPMRPKVSSYNLATSVGIALYKWSASS